MAAIVFPPTEVFLKASPAPEQQEPAQDQEDIQKTPKPKTTTKQRAPSTTAHNAVDKPRMSKSRTGCITCKLKRLKCDETKPTCQQCQRRKVECGGYKRDFKWRSFDETNAKTAPAQTRKKRTSISVPGPSNTTKSKSPDTLPDNLTVSPETVQSSDRTPTGTQPVDAALVVASEDPMLALDVRADTILATCDPTFVDEADPDFIIEEVLRPDFGDPSASQSLANSLALIPGESSWADNRYYKPVPRGLDYSPDGVEAIALRFDRVTCAILSVKNGASENPWRSLMWPMAQTSPSLFHALCAMTSFHSARKEPQFRVKGHEHMQICFHNLSEGLREDSVTLENAIATSITLAFAQCWNELTESGHVYIKGARSIIAKALTEHRHRPRQGSELDRLKFLCNAWVYLDVIVRLTCTDEDETDDYEEIFSAFSKPSVDHDGFGIDFGLPIDSRLDPLMGCANTLFPLIGRTSNLARRVRRSGNTSLAIIDQARELKDLIEAWRPPMYIQPPEDSSSTVEHSVQTAEAYRWATLLYLHQSVPDIPMATSSQLAAKVLVFLATVPLSSRFVIVHIFPLMAAGCEAVSAEDREWVRHRWAGLGHRLDIGTIDKCMELTTEVWRRRDEVGTMVNRNPLVSTAAMQTGRRQSYDLNPAAQSWTLDSSFSTFEGAVPVHAEQALEWDGNAGVDGQYQLGGRLHWLGVMKEWGWEVLLG